MTKRQRKNLSINNLLARVSLVSVVPLAIVSVVLVLLSDWSTAVQATLILGILLLVVWFAFVWNRRVARPLKTLESLLLSIGEEDFSLRVAPEAVPTNFAGLIHNANAIADQLRAERTGARESDFLLQAVMRQIDVGVLVLDHQGLVRLANDRACEILHKAREQILEQSCAEVGLEAALAGDATQVWSPPDGGESVFQLKRSYFRHRGKQRTLITLADLSAPLRQQELIAWQRMVKVLRHEVANSLAPIQSYGQTLSAKLAELKLPERDRDLFVEGLSTIENRSQALVTLLKSYRNLSGLPSPTLQPVELNHLVEDCKGFLPGRAIHITADNSITAPIDKAQIQQVLLNVLKNADEAMADTDAAVDIHLNTDEHRNRVTITVDDHGRGITSRENLFVPFFTTKPGGEGIGLVLSRLIVERHGGRFDLANRPDGGARASITLPLKHGPSV